MDPAVGPLPWPVLRHLALRRDGDLNSAVADLARCWLEVVRRGFEHSQERAVLVVVAFEERWKALSKVCLKLARLKSGWPSDDAGCPRSTKGVAFRKRAGRAVRLDLLAF